MMHLMSNFNATNTTHQRNRVSIVPLPANSRVEIVACRLLMRVLTDRLEDRPKRWAHEAFHQKIRSAELSTRPRAQERVHAVTRRDIDRNAKIDLEHRLEAHR